MGPVCSALCASLRNLIGTAVVVSCVAACAARPPQDDQGFIEPAEAHALVDRLVALVESKGLPPREVSAYAIAKVRLRASIEGDSPVNRRTLYRAARDYIGTLDADGHTLLWTEAESRRFMTSTSPQAAGEQPAADVVRSGRAEILLVRPPQSTFVDNDAIARYAAALEARIAGVIADRSPCGVVVDLTESKGGNAWPAFVVVGELLTERNAAR